MKITLEWDNEAEHNQCVDLAKIIGNEIKIRDVVGHILITNEVD